MVERLPKLPTLYFYSNVNIEFYAEIVFHVYIELYACFSYPSIYLVGSLPKLPSYWNVNIENYLMAKAFNSSFGPWNCLFKKFSCSFWTSTFLVALTRNRIVLIQISHVRLSSATRSSGFDRILLSKMIEKQRSNCGHKTFKTNWHCWAVVVNVSEFYSDDTGSNQAHIYNIFYGKLLKRGREWHIFQKMIIVTN